MRSQTNLVKRGSAFYFRMKVPADLREHYGKESIRKSLKGVTSVAEGRPEARRLADQYAAEFEKVRQLRAAPPVPLTSDLTASLGKLFEASTLQADDEARAQGLTEHELAAWAAEDAAELQQLRAAYARGDVGPVRERVADSLHQLGIEAAPDSTEFRTFARRYTEQRIRALQARALRNSGEIVDTPDSPGVEALRESIQAAGPARRVTQTSRRKGPGPTLADVVSYWKGTGAKAPRSLMTVDTLVREFNTLHGALPLPEITKAHFVALRDHLLQRVKPATVQARFNLLKAAYTVCVQDDQLGLTSNPLQTLKIRKDADAEKPRDAFTADQLQTLFDSPVFTEGARPAGGKGEAAFWAPLIALFTGARLDEVLSLRTDGVYLWEGVPVIHFRHRPELGQTLKGKAKNNRRVPVHPELLRLGLLGYVEEARTLGEWLFPEIDRTDKKRSHSSAWGAWFGRFLKQVGIKTDKLTFHSLRHTFKHYARASGIPEDHHDAMTGHTTAEVSRRYGSAEGYPVGALAVSMAQLRFGSLDLSRVHAFET